MGEISTSIYAACTVEAVFDGVDIDVSVTIPDPIVVSVDFFTNPASAGVTEHDKLTQESRELPAQHPASAISWGDRNVDEALQSLSINKENAGVAAGIMSAHLNEYDHSKIGLIDSKENAGVAQSIMDDHLDDYDHDNIPTSNEKAALAGTAGTPSATNKYVTNEDSRITSALQNLYSVYYLSNQNASIPTYKKLVADYSTLQTAIETITVTTSGTDTLVGVWTPNNFGTGERLIPQGLWKYFFRGRVQSTTGKKDAAIVTKLYKRNTLGVETFITESLPSPILSDVISIIRVDTPISEIILTTDEILVGKIYAMEVGGLGGSPTVEFQYANDTGTRVEVPSVGFHNHNESLNRDADDCHPISAITNLQETFDALPTTTASDTPASIATYNDYSLWLDENLKLHLIYNDGDSRQIVQVNGLRGVQGETGATGLQGIQGIKGDKGDQGVQGIKGDKGDQGVQGIQGDKGDQGVQGIQGDKGDQGVQGIQGVPGSDATVTKANVEAVLTGEITTHTHPGSGGLSQAQILALINLGTL